MVADVNLPYSHILLRPPGLVAFIPVDTKSSLKKVQYGLSRHQWRLNVNSELTLAKVILFKMDANLKHPNF